MIDENNNEPLIRKVINTSVLTTISAMILGFFSFLGWLGVTLITIQDNQTKIIKDIQYNKLKVEKAVEVISSEVFQSNLRISTINQPNSKDYNNLPKSAPSKPSASTEKQKVIRSGEINEAERIEAENRTNELKLYQERIQHQIREPLTEIK